jgi:hypothetical protein
MAWREQRQVHAQQWRHLLAALMYAGPSTAQHRTPTPTHKLTHAPA